MKTAYSSMLLLVLGGCAAGPDFHPPEGPHIENYTSATTATPVSKSRPQLVTQDNIPEQWWQLFQSEDLSQLVTLGLENSPTLTAAAARLRASQENLRADTGSLLYPTVDLPLNSSRQKISGATFGDAGNPSIFTLHNASINVTYDINLFGAGLRYLEYGQAVVDADAYQLEASRLTLTTNIVTTAITEASLREQLSALNSIIDDEAAVLDLVEKQFVIGVIPRADLLSQRATLALARTQIPVLEKALHQTRHQLATLIGQLPGDANEIPQIRLEDLTMPEEIPLTLPSTLTHRRPDVRAAEAVLHQASAQVGVATANLYPHLTLTASYGSESSRFADLFSAGSSIWGLGAGLTQPLFHGGELRAKRRAALATFDQAAALYRQSVLTAFQDVANALLALDMDSRQLDLQAQAEHLTSETLSLVRVQYRQGAVSYLALLDAQRSFQQARINLIKARVALYNDTAALIYALGGGWISVQPDTQQTLSDEQTIETTL